jgi:predicted RNase H-like HicB family nuclease
MAPKIKKLDIKIGVQIIKEDGVFVAQAPALELCTQGDTYEEAEEMLSEMIYIFFEECVEKGTLEEVLTDCGWTKTPRKREWVPPSREILTEKNELFTVPCPA